MKTELVASWILVNGRLDMCWTAAETMRLLDLEAYALYRQQKAATLAQSA